MSKAEEVLNLLRGRWRIDRDIAGEGAKLAGEAYFEPLPDGALAYRETGVLTLADGQALQAYRTYLYRPSNEDVVIEFADGPDKGKLFVRLSFGEVGPDSIEARDVHLCGDDIYQVRFTLRAPDAFETDIKVTGPKKAYRAFSRYSRTSRPTAAS